MMSARIPAPCEGSPAFHSPCISLQTANITLICHKNYPVELKQDERFYIADITYMNKIPIRIGLTYTGTEKKHQYYARWIQLDDQVEVVKLSAADDNLHLVDELDAIVLSGGIDAHPSIYGSHVTDYPNAPATFQPERDAFETAVFLRSQEQNLPVLAICRGMQLVNCILGGDLIQDLGPEANQLHRSAEADEKHEVIILRNTLLYNICGTTRDTANSAHHQCVHRLGSGLMMNAVSDDGIIEGMEWADKSGKPFLLGVQWHPERMAEAGIHESTLSETIRQHFLKTVRDHHLHRTATRQVIP